MKQTLARCGTDCSACEIREKTKCPTCHMAGGRLFWGECDVAKCTMDKGINNCSECNDFPCDLLKSFSYDKEHGDNGKRIENLRKLKEKTIRSIS